MSQQKGEQRPDVGLDRQQHHVDSWVGECALGVGPLATSSLARS